MKTTKNQAAAVRSYLATLGVSISHVQALEVIARGAGLRSRHVKAQAEQAASPAEAKFEEALALCAKRPYPAGAPDTVKDLMALLPELFTTAAEAKEFLEDSLDESIAAAADQVCLANAIRKTYIETGRTPEALAKALRSLVEHQVWGYKDYRTAYLFLSGSECYSGPIVSYEVEVDVPEPGATLVSTSNEMALAWTPEDVDAAQRQGWDIFSTNRDEETESQLVDGKPYGHRPFELQRDDEQELFDDDAAAHAFVRAAAQNGDKVAQRALAFLEKYSPAEYAAVMAAPAPK
jgi:protein-disulfide isomerase-like protein with CxxC motif